MEELQAVLAVIREFASYTNPCHNCWYCQIRHLKLIFPWAAEEPLQFCPWRALVGVIWTELCSHNNHPRNGTFSCVSHSCSKWNSDFRSLRNSHITHTWVIPRSPLMALFLSCPTIRLLKNLNSCFDCNINPQYNSNLLVCVLYSHMLPLCLHCDGWRFQGVTPQSRVLLLVWRVLVRSVFFWRTRCHTLVREAHPARSVALCSALSSCCVEVMTAGVCVCANHLLAREDPCSTQTNMRILLVFIRFYASWNSRNPTCTVFPLTHSCYYVQTSLSTSYFLNEDVLVCAFLLTMSFPSPARLCIERSIRTMKASSCSAMMLLLHQVSVCSQGQKQYAVNCTTASSGWYAACKRDVIGYRFTGHSAKIACLVASNANSDSFQTGLEEPRVTPVCLAEDVFSLLSDLAPLLPRDRSDRVALPRCLIIQLLVRQTNAPQKLTLLFIWHFETSLQKKAQRKLVKQPLFVLYGKWGGLLLCSSLTICSSK